MGSQRVRPDWATELNWYFSNKGTHVNLRAVKRDSCTSPGWEYCLCFSLFEKKKKREKLDVSSFRFQGRMWSLTLVRPSLVRRPSVRCWGSTSPAGGALLELIRSASKGQAAWKPCYLAPLAGSPGWCQPLLLSIWASPYPGKESAPACHWAHQRMLGSSSGISTPRSLRRALSQRAKW